MYSLAKLRVMVRHIKRKGVLSAFPVKPICGGIFVFPHGACAAPLHEENPVLKSCKYVVRSEVE